MADRESLLLRIAHGTEHILGELAVRCYRRAGLTLAFVALLTGLAGWFSRDLSVNSDLAELLPKTFPSIQDLDKLTKRFGGVGWIIVVGRDAEPEQLRRFADETAPKLEKLQFVRYVDYQRPSAFLEDRALFFLDTDDLQKVNDRLKTRMDWEKQKRNPLYLDLEEDSEPPPLTFDDIKEKYLGKADDSAGSDQNTFLAKQIGEPYYIDEKEGLIALMAKPASQAIDLAASKVMVEEVEAMLATLDLKAYGPNFNVSLTGRYKKRVDLQRQISSDLQLTSLVATVLVLLYLAFHFRRVAAVLLVFAPLLAGLVWTFGFTAEAFGSLNILTGFVGAIMAGMGVDQGIHLMSRYEAERAEGRDAETAVRRTFGQTGRAIAVAAVTNCVAFAMLSLSEFRAFKEFGLVAAVGMVLSVGAFMVALPPLLAVAHRLGWQTRPIAAEGGATRWAAFLVRFAKPILIGSVAVVLAAGVLSRWARFDYDFASLESTTLESYVVDKQVNQILGFSYVPVAILTESVAEERMITAALRERKKTAAADTRIDFVAASADILPLNQEAKVPYLRAIGETIKGVKASWLEDPKMRSAFETLQRAVKAEPFGRDDMPSQLKLLFKGVGGQGEQGFVLVFPAVDLSDGEQIIDFAHEVRNIQLPDGRRVSAAGEDLILADILMMIGDEAPTIMTLSFVGIIVVMLLLLGGMRDAILCLSAPVASMILTMGLLPIFGVKVNYLNMVVLPTLFGMGEDGSAHLLTRVEDGEPPVRAIPEVARGVFGALITTMFGFGSLILANHGGLESFGALALIGLGANMFISLVAFPALLVVVEARRRAKTANASTSASVSS